MEINKTIKSKLENIEEEYRWFIKKVNGYKEYVRENLPNYEDVLDKLEKQLNGLTLRKKAIKEVKQDFKDNVLDSFSDKDYKIKNNKISIWDFMYYYNNYNGRLTIDRGHSSSDRLKLILRVISYFDFNRINYYPFLTNFYNKLTHNFNMEENDLFDGKKEIKKTEKVESLRFYKNLRIGIYFKNNQCRDQFLELFDLE